MSEININHTKLCLLISRECKKVLQNFLLLTGDDEDWSKADITSMCKTLSNTYKMVPRRFDAKNGNWNALPSLTDRSEGADVFRIRIRRNQLCHDYFGGIDDEKFMEFWEELEDICTNRLRQDTTKGIGIIKQITCVTSEIKEEYEKMIEAWKKEPLEPAGEDYEFKMGPQITVACEEMETGRVSSRDVELTNCTANIAEKAMDMASHLPKGNMKINITAKKKVKMGDCGCTSIKVNDVK